MTTAVELWLLQEVFDSKSIPTFCITVSAMLIQTATYITEVREREIRVIYHLRALHAREAPLLLSVRGEHQMDT